MDRQASKALFQRLIRLYTQQEYEQALILLKQEGRKFTEDAKDIFYWSMCMAALLGRQQEALQFFRAGLDQGHWFVPTFLLERETDLISVRNLPEFQAMATLCQQRLVEAQAKVQSELLVRGPTEVSKPSPLFIALHGNTFNGPNTQPEWEAVVNQGYVLAVPQSTQMIGEEAYVWDNLDQGEHEIQMHLNTLQSSYKLDMEHIVLGGFSRGGGLAAWLALSQSIKAWGFVLLAPALTSEELQILSTALEKQKPEKLRGVIFVGEKDFTVCQEISQEIEKLMQKHDFVCKMEFLPDGHHEYPANFTTLLTQSLAFLG